MRKIINNINKKMLLLKNKNERKLSKKQGVVLAETVLIIAISLVIIITVFYPTFRNIVNETFASISSWYKSTLSSLGIT